MIHRNCIWFALIALSTACCCQAATSQDTHAGRGIQESGQASTHASASAAHALIASGQVTSAVSAVPLAVGGAVLTSAGKASTAAAKNLQAAAAASVGTPLKITDESLITMPPDQALQR